MTTLQHPPTPPPPPPTTEPPRHTGRIVGGVLLILFGLGWLFDVLGLEFPWDLVLPGVLIVVGLALLVVGGRGGSHVALVTVGIVVTVFVLLGPLVNAPFAGGIGERTIRPVSITGVEDDYRLGIGQLTVDLSDVDDFASSSSIRDIQVRAGMGQVTVIVPPTASVRIEARASLGTVQLFDQEASGFDVERTSAGGGDLDAEITVTVGLGQVTVRRG